MIETRILDKAISLFQPDAARIELAKKRQAAIWNNQPADYLPLCLQTDVPESSEFGLDFDMVEEHEHLEVMFYKGLWGMIAAARSGSDSVPSIRPNFGTCFVPSMFGLAPDILPHTLPWLKKHLTKEQIKKFEVPDDVSNLGLMPKALVALDYYRGKLGDGFTYLADTQSPFDIAHLVRGDDIFLDLYDDPPFAHHLLELAVEMYVKATKLMKQRSGEPLNSGCHGNSLWMANGGVRACEDSSTLLSPAAVDEFVMPYLLRALEEFGGGWVHYCGSNDRLLDALIADAPPVRGINFGNPERHDHTDLLPRLLEKGKFYYGSWPRLPDETDRRYFERILAPLDGERRGLILTGGVDSSTPEKCKAVMELWQELQE